MEKINVVLVMLNPNGLERALLSLNFANANLIAIVADNGNGQLLNFGERKILLAPFSAVQELINTGKNFVWLISGSEGNIGDLWKFKKFLMNSGVPEANVVNFELMYTLEWLANLRYVEKYGADFFATGGSHAEVGLDLRYVPHARGKGVNLSGSNQDLRQGYLTAKYVFEHIKPGTIKFVLIGLEPYSFRYTNAEDFSVCSRNLQYMLALNVPEETPQDRLLKILISSKVKNLFAKVTAEQADLNFERTKTVMNANMPAKALINWEAELDNLTKKLRPKVIEKNLGILKDYIKLCLQNGAKPVGVIFPFAPIIRQNYDEELLTLFRLAIRQLEESYDFNCVDLFDLPLGYDCFYNTAHLNLRGAAFSSTALSLRLYEKKLVTTENFVDMPYSYFTMLAGLLPKDQYNALIDSVFRASAQMIRRKDKIEVGFVSYDASMWCGDELYNYFARDKRFEPTIFLCLRTDEGDKESVQKDFRHGVEQFKARGLNVVPVTERNSAVPAQDVLIFLTPYLEVLPNAFQFSNMTARTLTIYIPYGFAVSQWYSNLSMPVMFILWKNFMESKFALELFEEKSKIGASRGIYSGYPKMDTFFKDKSSFRFDWKTTRRKSKKIIWAPHWSIDDGVKYSTFQWNWQFMYDFAKAHPEISWVVKPHPNLLFSAVKTGLFPSAEAFEAYLKAWDALPNAQVYTGAYYQALFATSDGMILDSGSFIAEYQYVDKPMIFLTRDTQKFNELAEKILAASYLVDGRDLRGIAATMQKVFIEGNDPLKGERRKIFDEYLNYPKANGMLAGEFIYRNIADDLKGEH